MNLRGNPCGTVAFAIKTRRFNSMLGLCKVRVADVSYGMLLPPSCFFFHYVLKSESAGPSRGPSSSINISHGSLKYMSRPQGVLDSAPCHTDSWSFCFFKFIKRRSCHTDCYRLRLGGETFHGCVNEVFDRHACVETLSPTWLLAV